MSMNANRNPVVESIRHLDDKYKKINDLQSDCKCRMAAGENPDPNEFIKLLAQQSVTSTAMTAQFGLLQKPLKTVLADSR